MTGNSILIGRVFGIPIRVHILLVILLPVLAMVYSNSFIYGLILVIGVFASVALHELGHSFVAMRKGCYVKEIILSPIGGVAKMSNIPSKPVDEFQVAIAGPLVSLTLAVVLIPLPFFFWIGVVNAGLFLFNLLPAFPMDGGRVLRAFLTKKKGRLEATRIAAAVGKYFCVFFVIVGLFGFGYLRPNLFLAVIGFYIYRAGQMEYRMVMMEHQANHWSGYSDGQIDVEVSPPPYENSINPVEKLKNKVSGFFKHR